MGLVEPMSCGIGGDIFVIYWDAKTQKLYGLNGSGRSPYKLTREVFTQKGLKEIPAEGPLSWYVPGCVAGWEDLRAQFGTKPLCRTACAGDRLRRKGLSGQRDHRRRLEFVAAVVADTGPTRPRRTCPAASAERRADLSQSEPGAQLSRHCRPRSRRLLSAATSPGRSSTSATKNGGYFTLQDFADHKSDWIEPVSTNYRGYDVWELPPNGQGIAGARDPEPARRVRPARHGAWQSGLAAFVHRGQEAGLRRSGEVLCRSRFQSLADGRTDLEAVRRRSGAS